MDELGRAFVSISEDWRATYPSAVAGFLVMQSAGNPRQAPALDAEKTRLEAELRARFGGLSRAELREVFPLLAYTAYYRRFRKTYHVLLQLESVALHGRAIPRAAALVEAMFIAELKNLLLTAGHDLAALRLPIRVAVADGSESYTLLSGAEQTLTAGDMYMADGAGIISSVLFGPAQRAAIVPETTAALFAVYAPPGIGKDAVAHHLADIAANVRCITPRAQVESLEVVEA